MPSGEGPAFFSLVFRLRVAENSGLREGSWPC